jgi:hypothetical protein
MDELAADAIAALTHIHIDATSILARDEIHPELQEALTWSVEELEAAFPFLVRPV